MKTTHEKEAPCAGSSYGTLSAGRVWPQRKVSAKAVKKSVGWVELDPLIHERTRLAILTSLSASLGGSLSFPDLRNTLSLTDGNLMAHLRALDFGKLVELHKTGAGRNSSTSVRLTERGRKAFRSYLGRLEELVRAARGSRPTT